MAIKLYYFDAPGVAEPIRLAFKSGNVEFEDVRVPRDQWPELKKRMPFGQMPAIEVDGTLIAQSTALLTFAAKKAGLYPEDPLKAALSDQVVVHLQDFMGLLDPAFAFTDPEEQMKVRQQIAASAPFKEKFDMLAKLIDGQLYVAGDKLSHGDMTLFCCLSILKSGVSAALVDDVLVLKDYRNRIASLDFVKDYYAGFAPERVARYKPDA